MAEPGDSFTLLQETSEFVLINKHPGVSFHTEDGQPGLFEQVRQLLGKQTLYPVHRLDKVTSGLLLLAKTEAANHALCEAFAKHSIEKYYLALASQKPRKKQGGIRGDMQKSRRGQWKLLRSQDNPAITRFVSVALGNGLRAFLLKPKTGKTHQIRVAMKSLGSPILGDALYAGEKADRTYLHAYALRFELFGQSYCFVCPPDTGCHYRSLELSEQCQTWQQPWELPWRGN